jgi:branched-chain amino acid transport system substrate-binding protein
VAEQLATRDTVDLYTATYMSAVPSSASDTALRYGKLYWETNATMQELTDRGVIVRSGKSGSLLNDRKIQRAYMGF